MKYTTIFEKLICLFEIASDSWLYIAFFAIITLLLFLLGFKKISKRSCFLLSCLACFIIFGFTLYQYFEPISKMFDSLMKHLFTEIYFPSAYAYLFILLGIDIIAVGSLLNPHTSKVYKTIHGISFVVMNFVLTIVLEMIAKNKIDIFSKKSLFSNTDFVVLLEFSMNIFILWCISLLAGYVINIVTERIMVSREKKENIKSTSLTSELEVTISDEKLKEEYQNTDTKESKVFEEALNVNIEDNSLKVDTVDTSKKYFIPKTLDSIVVSEEKNTNKYYFNNVDPEFVAQPATSINLFDNMNINRNVNLDYSVLSNDNVQTNTIESNCNTFDLSSFIPKKQEVRPIIPNYNTTNYSNNNTDELLERILNNNLPLSYPNEPVKLEEKKVEVNAEKDTYTLNDYRIFNKMLKDIREHNQSNSVKIDKMLEYRLITKYSTETYDMFKKMLKIYSN